MKCRRSKLSRGARLRGAAKGALRKKLAAARGHQSAAPASTPTSSLSAALPELRIDGHTEGSIQYTGAVVVAAHGVVIGDIHAKAILVEGEITGDLNAEETLRIAASARITGRLQSPRIAIAPGALLRGTITMRRGPVQPSELDDLEVETLLTGDRRV